MTDIAAAFAAIQARAAAEIAGLPLLWQNEDNELPDEPAPFAYFELITDLGAFIELGGGRGSNRQRTEGELHAYVFAPRGVGLAAMLERAETVAAAFRSYRGGGISCQSATVHPAGEGEALVPPGVRSVAGNFTCCIVSIPIHFDQIG